MSNYRISVPRQALSFRRVRDFLHAIVGPGILSCIESNTPVQPKRFRLGAFTDETNILWLEQHDEAGRPPIRQLERILADLEIPFDAQVNIKGATGQISPQLRYYRQGNAVEIFDNVDHRGEALVATRDIELRLGMPLTDAELRKALKRICRKSRFAGSALSECICPAPPESEHA